jgi:hypothetical protein
MRSANSHVEHFVDKTNKALVRGKQGWALSENFNYAQILQRTHLLQIFDIGLPIFQVTPTGPAMSRKSFAAYRLAYNLNNTVLESRKGLESNRLVLRYIAMAAFVSRVYHVRSICENGTQDPAGREKDPQGHASSTINISSLS